MEKAHGNISIIINDLKEFYEKIANQSTVTPPVERTVRFETNTDCCSNIQKRNH